MKKTIDLIIIILGGLVLCFMGFYNNYPLVFPDDGTYILSGFQNYVPEDRPLIYGLFIRHVSLWESLWIVMVTQGMMLSLVIYYYFYYFISSETKRIYFLIFIFIITIFTGVSINVSQLLPDMFAPVFILVLGLFLFAGQIKWRDIIILSVFFVISLTVHASHLMILLMAMTILTVVYLFPQIRASMNYLKVKRVIGIWFLIVLSYVGVSLTHLAFGGGFVTSRGGHVFLMARLFNMGILQEYLKENCGKYHFKICEFKDDLPTDFLWDIKKSPIYKTGGWIANKEEYTAITRDILTTPKYLKRYLSKSVQSSLQQFVTFETGITTVRQPAGTRPHIAIEKYFKHEVKEYLHSRQNIGALNFDFLNNRQLLLTLFTFLLSIILLLSKTPVKIKWMIAFFLFILYINAGVCGALSIVSPRYQSRIIWVIILPVFLLIADRTYMDSLISGIINRIEQVRKNLKMQNR